MSYDPKSERTAITAVGNVVPQRQAGEACLVLIYGGELGKRFILAEHAAAAAGSGAVIKELTVGRSLQADIQIGDDSVSRKHATFVVHGDGRVLLRDLGSTNGTAVNDQAVHERWLQDGDLIKVGRSIFKYLKGHNIEAQYHEEIYRLTTTDGLTGAYNKRYFVETLEREMGRCYRYARPLCVVMIDVDHFKGINDTYGHLAGDAALKQLAALIADHVRKEDVFARYGGEEFGLILPEVNVEGGVALAEKLRALVEGSTFSFEDKSIRATASIGVASFPGADIGAQAFIQMADECLYEAKRRGRNQVVSRGDE